MGILVIGRTCLIAKQEFAASQLLNTKGLHIAMQPGSDRASLILTILTLTLSQEIMNSELILNAVTSLPPDPVLIRCLPDAVIA